MSAPISLADVRGLSLDVDVIARELSADDGDREVALRAINRMQGILARLSLDLIAQDEAVNLAQGLASAVETNARLLSTGTLAKRQD